MTSSDLNLIAEPLGPKTPATHTNSNTSEKQLKSLGTKTPAIVTKTPATHTHSITSEKQVVQVLSDENSWTIRYAKFLQKPLVSMFVILTLISYLFGSIYGCSRLTASLDATKLLRDNSPANDFFDLLNNNRSSAGMLQQVFVMNPPDLENFTELGEFFKFVKELEGNKFSTGPSNTILWLRAFFGSKIIQIQDSSRPLCDRIEEWDKYEAGDFYSYMMNFDDSKRNETGKCLKNFMFAVGVSNKQDDIDGRTENIQFWRSVTARYRQFNATVVDDLALFLDQVQTIPQITTLTLGEAMLVMTLIILIFSPSFLCAFFVIFTMLSIDAGVVGSLALLGASLDPISAVTLLISIGFSVNFTAHITYRFYKTGAIIDDRRQRVQFTLYSIAWPSMQSATSAFLGICLMGIVPAYMVRVFFQTTALVIFFGLFHALAVLPVFFSWLKF